MTTVLTLLQGVAAILITFGLAVFVHEFGHMAFALLRGVGVETFAIGMGPKIRLFGRTLQWHWREIEFSLRWFPVGGFVKLRPPRPPAPPAGDEAASGAEAQPPEGEGPSVTESSYDDFYVLAGRDTLTKLLVFGGGVFMNLVTAILATALLLYIGEEVSRTYPIVERIEPEAAALAGLEPGDRIVAVNGRPTRFVSDVQEAALDALARTPQQREPDAESDRPARPTLELTVERGGETRTVRLELAGPAEWTRWFRGIEFRVPPVIGQLLPRNPAERAGLKPGDRIVAINDQPVETFAQLARIIHENPGRPCRLRVQRGDAVIELTVTPEESPLGEPGQGMIGILPAGDEVTVERVANPLAALAQAPLITARQLVLIVDQTVDFFRRATLDQVGRGVGGPVAIAMMTARQARQGIRSAINWFILLNLLLLIFNLLPLPVLDGGFILLSLIEAVLRRPVPPRILAPIYSVFVFLFIGLMVVVTVLDIRNWFF